MNNMAIFILIISVTGVLYAILIVSFSYGWDRLKGYRMLTDGFPKISIVVAARNEAQNIHFLLESLLTQDYPRDLYEIIIVDDHSEDGTAALIKDMDTENRVNLIHLEKQKRGKKKALLLGIQRASGELIATTDADCIPAQQWLKTIASAYTSGGYKMMAGPVMITEPKAFWEKFQAMELLSLVASGAGAVAIQKPVMCNGANLAFEKEAFFLVGAYQGNEHLAGGDDIFLMEKFKKKFSARAITFLKNKQAIVRTKGTAGVKEFINQRIRWVAKSPAYTDPFLIFTSLTVLAFNLLILSSFIAALFDDDFLVVGLISFLIKSLVDIILLWKVSTFSNQRYLIKYLVFFQMIYIPFTALMGIIGNIAGYRWKGR